MIYIKNELCKISLAKSISSFIYRSWRLFKTGLYWKEIARSSRPGPVRVILSTPSYSGCILTDNHFWAILKTDSKMILSIMVNKDSGGVDFQCLVRLGIVSKGDFSAQKYQFRAGMWDICSRDGVERKYYFRGKRPSSSESKHLPSL